MGKYRRPGIADQKIGTIQASYDKSYLPERLEIYYPWIWGELLITERFNVSG
jgi:hypothetical protein